MTLKLKTSELKQTRIDTLERQSGSCAICGMPCTLEQAVLDHDHRTGLIRGSLHRGCNAVEGKVLSSMKRYGIQDHEGFLLGLIQYYRTHSTDQTGFIHPLYRTPAERRQRSRLRAKKKRNAK